MIAVSRNFNSWAFESTLAWTGTRDNKRKVTIVTNEDFILATVHERVRAHVKERRTGSKTGINTSDDILARSREAAVASRSHGDGHATRGNTLFNTS
jgi:hypothetical protein